MMEMKGGGIECAERLVGPISLEQTNRLTKWITQPGLDPSFPRMDPTSCARDAGAGQTDSSEDLDRSD